MRKPIIGLTTGRRNRRTSPDELQSADMACKSAYPQAVIRSGGAPILLPCTEDAEAVAAAVGVVDGLLLTGGGDVVALAYGEEPHPTAKGQDPVRDAAELQAIRVALDRGIPILGICRGIQALNVAFGGTLIQDIPSQVPGAFQHYTHAAENMLAHTVDIEADSLLAQVLAVTSMAVNSRHHQAVKELGAGLRTNCRARDGVIEGIEASNGRPVLAVQCHPEDSAKDRPLFQKLFDWLVEEAGASRSR